MQDSQRPPTKVHAKRRISLARAASWTLVALGAVALTVSIITVFSTLALIGLGLIFWGAILNFVQTQEYTKEILLPATVNSILTTLDQTLQQLGYEGKAVYLPPKYLRNPEDNKAYIPKQKNANLPTPEQIQKQETEPPSNSEGILVTPPGAGLTKLFEKTLDTDFMKKDLQYLQQNMPKLFIEDLEIATDLEITAGPSSSANPTNNSPNQTGKNQNSVHVRIGSTVYKDVCKEAEKLPNVYTTLGCPLSSAIACALARATGKPITIENGKTSEDGKTIEIDYRILEEEQTQP
jgi:hypothetical protein